MGRIVNEREAFSACSCYRINPRKGNEPQNLVCFSRGVIGTLTKVQNEKCNDVEFLATPRNLQRHFEKFKEMGLVSAPCLTNEQGKDTIEFYECLSKEAKKQIKSKREQKELN